jgi:hypothetical protein
MKVTNRRIIGVVAGGLLLVSGGVALAASDLFGSSKRTSREIIATAAADLGVSAEELRDALQSASGEQVDAALEAGAISQEQAEAMRDMIESGHWPFLGVPGPHFLGGPGRPVGPLGFAAPLHPDLFAAAADFLGLTEAQIRSRLSNGRSLAEIARTEDKSVDGLVDALNARHRATLQAEVEDGRLTDAQRDEILECTEERVREFVHRGLMPRGLRPSFRIGPIW